MTTETIVRVSSAVAPLHAEPKASSEQVSQSVAGHLATILEVREGWRRVRLGDGYEGWMHEGYLERGELAADEVSAWKSSARYSLGCTVHDATTGAERALPLGARVAHEADHRRGGCGRRGGDASPLSARSEARSVRRPLDGSRARRISGAGSRRGAQTAPGWCKPCSACTALHCRGMRGSRRSSERRSSFPPMRGCPVICSSSRIAPMDASRTSRSLRSQDTLMHVAIGRGGFAVEHLDGSMDPYAVALRGRLRSARRLLAP